MKTLSLIICVQMVTLMTGVIISTVAFAYFLRSKLLAFCKTDRVKEITTGEP